MQTIKEKLNKTTFNKVLLNYYFTIGQHIDQLDNTILDDEVILLSVILDYFELIRSTVSNSVMFRV